MLSLRGKVHVRRARFSALIALNQLIHQTVRQGDLCLSVRWQRQERDAPRVLRVILHLRGGDIFKGKSNLASSARK